MSTMAFKKAVWPRRLRSQDWFEKGEKHTYIHRSWAKNQGLPDDALDGRPIIGICNTWSEFTPCNAHLRDIAERVKRGVYEAGGVPFEFPVFSTGESMLRPTAMLFRNLLSMDAEEAIRGNPMDGVVLLSGCDKTTPALLMGAASVDIPAIMVTGGPMLNGKFHGEDLAAGSDVWRFSEMVRSGEMSPEDFTETEQGHARSSGHCNTMGTASSMASMAEALGMTLSGNAAIPAVDARRRVMAQISGRRIVDMVKDDLKPSDVLTRHAFENAIKTNAAIGGSTNAVIHLLALAGRIGVTLTLDDWDAIGSGIPTILNLRPSGKYLMEEFFYAGGLPVVLRQLADTGVLHGEALTVSGRSIGEEVAGVENWNTDVILPPDRPLMENGGIAVLRGNLAPDGVIIKPSAASADLMKHRGRAVVFETIEDYKSRIDDDTLDVDETCVLVLKNCGPKGYPGMAEVGNMGLPPKLLRKGVKDMVRISDARMSGTAYGTIFLHASPEAAMCGPLAIVRDGDMIEVDVPNRRIHLELSDDEISERLRNHVPEPVQAESGYARLYIDHVGGADTGADFDFLKGKRGAHVSRHSH